MMIAVLFQNFDFWIALIAVTMNSCSSSGSEYPACPSMLAGALRKLTAGRLSAASASKKSWISYSWFAPVSAAVPYWLGGTLGRVWFGFAVLAQYWKKA